MSERTVLPGLPAIILATVLLAAPGLGPGLQAAPQSPLDGDGDGVVGVLDCDDTDAGVWSIPGEAPDLALGGDGQTLSWGAPADPGGVAVRYDLLRSTLGSGFLDPVATTCVAQDVIPETAVDAGLPAPGGFFHYLVVAGNDCGDGTPGVDSTGAARTALACDCPLGCDDADVCTADACAPGGCQHTVIPPLFRSPPQSIAVCPGDTARFAVAVAGTGAVRFQWKLNGVNVGTDAAELTLAGVTPAEDGAQITCTVTDDCTAVESVAATLTVFSDAASCLGGGGGYEAPNGAGRPPGAADPRRPPHLKNAGDVHLHAGEFTLEEVDLSILGRGLDFRWARTYRSREGRPTAMGEGWDFSYNLWIEVSPLDPANRLLHDGAGRIWTYRPDGPTCWVADGRFDQLCAQLDGTYILTHEDRTFMQFFAPAAGGKIALLEDPDGNRMEFLYDALGRLQQVTDVLGRAMLVLYDPQGKIAEVADFAGRSVRYAYYGPGEAGGSPGDLKSVTSPAVTGTPNGDDFPQGKTTTYTYTAGLPEPALNHNLLTIIDPKGVTFLRNVYTTELDPLAPRFDRLDRQDFPDGSVGFAYVPQTPSPGNGFAVTKTIVNDRTGNVRELLYDALDRLVLYREHTGRAPQPAIPTGEATNRPVGPVRPTDPATFETRYAWNADSLPQRVILPEGNEVEYVYDDLNPDPRLRGRRLQRTRRPGSRGGDQPQIVETWAHQITFGGRCDCPMGGTDYWTTYVDGRGLAHERQFDAQGNLTRYEAPAVSTGVLGGGTQTIAHTWSYNSSGQVSEHVWPDGRIDQFTYHASGPGIGRRATKVVDAGNLALTWSYTYDQVGNLVARTDPEGNTESWVFNQLDQIVRHVAPAPFGYLTDFFHDANGEVLREEVQNLDEAGLPGPDPWLTTRYFTDELERVIRTERELTNGVFLAHELEYDANGNRILARSAEAISGAQPTAVEHREYDERDLLFRQSRGWGGPDVSSDQFDWDGNGNLIAHHEGLEDASGPHALLRTWDGYDRPVAVTDAEGNVTSFTYDANGNVLTGRTDGELIEGESGQSSRLAEKVVLYDEVNRPVQVDRLHFDPMSGAPIGDGASVRHTYWSPAMLPVRIEDDNAAQQDYAYDGAHRLQTVSDAEGNLRTFAYDGNSNLTSVTYEEASQIGSPTEIRVETYDYDALDRLTRAADAAGNAWEYRHDSRGNTTRVLDPRGNETRYLYDALDRLVRIERTLTDTGDGGGNPVGIIVTDHVWDGNSRLIGSTDDNGHQTAYEYDALDRIVHVGFADLSAQDIGYDVHDNPVSLLDANGTQVTSSYDRKDRLVSRVVLRGPGVLGTTTETYKWSGLGLLAWAENDATLVTRRHDSLSNRIEERLRIGAGPEQLVLAGHDGKGNVLSMTYPSGRTIERSYDALDRVRSIREGPLELVHFDYIGPSTLERRDYSNDVRLTYQRDTARRIVRARHVFDPGGIAQPLLDLSASWDPVHRKTSRADLLPGGTVHDYAYDSVGQLVASVETPAAGPPLAIDYDLDGVGNRIGVSGGPSPGSYTMDPTLPEPGDHQMCQYTATPFDTRVHDAAGNLTIRDAGPGAVLDLLYDYRNLPVQMSFGSGWTWLFTYDALGRRVQVTADDGVNPPSVIRFFYDGWRAIEEQDDTGGTLATYVHGRYLDDVLSMRRDTDGDMIPEDLFFHKDEMANVFAVSDAAGLVVERYDYDDFGAPRYFNGAGLPIPGSAIGNPYLFAGRRYDEGTGLYYFRNRYLDPRAGRFTTRDPIGIWGDPGNLGNGYSYAGNDPWSGSDPWGLLDADYEDCSSSATTNVREALFTAEDVVYEGFEHFGRDSDYVTYFDGDDKTSRYRTVQDRVGTMKKIFYSKKITIKCKEGTDKGDTLARTWRDGKNHIALYKGYFDYYSTIGVYSQPFGVFILNHEIAHESGANKDAEYCPYSDSACLDLAADQPKKAKSNAENYMLYMGQYYSTVTASSGSSTSSGGSTETECDRCMDRYPESVAATKCSGVCGCDICPELMNLGDAPYIDPDDLYLPDATAIADRIQP